MPTPVIRFLVVELIAATITWFMYFTSQSTPWSGWLIIGNVLAGLWQISHGYVAWKRPESRMLFAVMCITPYPAFFIHFSVMSQLRPEFLSDDSVQYVLFLFLPVLCYGASLLSLSWIGKETETEVKEHEPEVDDFGVDEVSFI